jgi:hypothetical protein
MADMNVAYSPSHGLGEEQSIWFKLTPLLSQENPMQVLMALSDKYGGVIPINLKNQRVVSPTPTTTSNISTGSAPFSARA